MTFDLLALILAPSRQIIYSTSTMNSSELEKFVISNLEEMKAKDIVSLNVRKLTDITDSMIICSATSSRHAKSTADFLVSQCKAQNYPPIGVEGTDFSEWILVDLGDVIVHIMLPSARDFYSLEKLWGLK